MHICLQLLFRDKNVNNYLHFVWECYDSNIRLVHSRSQSEPQQGRLNGCRGLEFNRYVLLNQNRAIFFFIFFIFTYFRPRSLPQNTWIVWSVHFFMFTRNSHLPQSYWSYLPMHRQRRQCPDRSVSECTHSTPQSHRRAMVRETDPRDRHRWPERECCRDNLAFLWRLREKNLVTTWQHKTS